MSFKLYLSVMQLSLGFMLCSQPTEKNSRLTFVHDIPGGIKPCLPWPSRYTSLSCMSWHTSAMTHNAITILIMLLTSCCCHAGLHWPSRYTSLSCTSWHTGAMTWPPSGASGLLLSTATTCGTASLKPGSMCLWAKSPASNLASR